jgi:tetratricopeptide (TPR) repeat protein
MKGCRIRLFASVLSFVLVASAFSQSGNRNALTQPTVTDLVGKCSGAVVQIVTSDANGKEIALGSGFIVSADGKIVTNYHVIKGAHSAVSKLPDGASFTVEGVLAFDPDKDLALLKVDGNNLPFLALSPNSGIHVGDHVIAIGSPLGLEGSVSDGIISALRNEKPDEKWIQTTAPVSHGSSGGPLLNMNGDVVGVITWGLSAQDGQSLNFAIPSDTVQKLTSSAGKLISLDSITSKTAGDAISVDHDKAASLDSDGLIALNAKQYEQAIHAFKEAIRLNPEDADAWHGVGVAHELLEQFEESTSDFKQAVKYAPDNKTFWLSLGFAYSARNKNEDALSALQEAVEIDPEYATGWFWLGKIYDALHNYDQSLRCYKNATLYKPDYAEAWYELGVASKNEDESIAALKRAVTLKPDYAAAWIRLGSTYDTMKRYDEAIAAWKEELGLKATDANVSDAKLWYYIGGDYSNLNDFKNAKQADMKALDLEKTSQYHTTDDNQLIPSICLSLSQIYEKMGKHRQADYYNKTWIFMVQHPNP